MGLYWRKVIPKPTRLLTLALYFPCDTRSLLLYLSRQGREEGKFCMETPHPQSQRKYILGWWVCLFKFWSQAGPWAVGETYKQQQQEQSFPLPAPGRLRVSSRDLKIRQAKDTTSSMICSVLSTCKGDIWGSSSVLQHNTACVSLCAEGITRGFDGWGRVVSGVLQQVWIGMYS